MSSFDILNIVENNECTMYHKIYFILCYIFLFLLTENTEHFKFS